MGLSKPWALALSILALVMAIALLLTNQYFLVLRHGKPIENPSTYFSLPSNVHVFMIGPKSLINNLTSMGIPSSSISLITPNELPSILNDSVVIIDWNYVNKTLHMNYDELAKALENSMGRNDLIVIISENPNEVLMLEETIAVAWGNYYRSKVIGFPVFPVNGPSYVVGFGSAGLIINVIPINQTQRLKLEIEYWYSTTHKIPMTVGTNFDSTNQDPCLYIQTNYGGQLNGQYGWFFSTGLQSIKAYYNGLQSTYQFDYCIIVANSMSTGTIPEIPIEYLGFMTYQPGFSGGYFAYYRAGINMTTAWNDYYGVLNGINSYMGYAGGTGIEPGTITCMPGVLSYISISVPLPLGVTLNFQFQSTASGISTTDRNFITDSQWTPTVALNDIVWWFAFLNQWTCLPQITSAGAWYPVGFEVDSGAWALVQGSNKLNTAVSPVYWERGVVCYGSYKNSFSSVVYFVLEYQPGTPWTVKQLSINYPYGGTYNVIYGTNTCP
ncbi:hypothetical protein [Vulcanisaeta moutnovskia]|nr:hypothetical protein [Vulcanisaeta moutnovskia]